MLDSATVTVGTQGLHTSAEGLHQPMEVPSVGVPDAKNSSNQEFEGTSKFCMKTGSVRQFPTGVILSIGEAHRGGCGLPRPSQTPVKSPSRGMKPLGACRTTIAPNNTYCTPKVQVGLWDLLE